MKKQKPTQGALKRLLALYNGEELTLSETQTRLFDKMKREGVIVPASQHGSRTTYKAVSFRRTKHTRLAEFSRLHLRRVKQTAQNRNTRTTRRAAQPETKSDGWLPRDIRGAHQSTGRRASLHYRPPAGHLSLHLRIQDV